jgi:uncharacterized protein DUF4232
MKSLLIAALAAASLATCACGSLSGGAPQVTGGRPGRPHGHRAPPPSRRGRHGRRPGARGRPRWFPGGRRARAAASEAAAPAPPPPAPCLSRYLGASAGIGQGPPGSSYVVIDFKNLNNHPCTLYGYPGISLASGKPVTPVGQAVIENPATPRQLVTLAPGGVANDLLRIAFAAGYPAAKCAPVTAHWLQIFPSNQTVPIYRHFTSTACAKPVKLLTVNVVVPGSAAEPRRGAGARALPASVPPVTSTPPEMTGGTPPGPSVYPGLQGQERCQQRSPRFVRTHETRWPARPVLPSPPHAGDGLSGNFAYRPSHERHTPGIFGE